MLSLLFLCICLFVGDAIYEKFRLLHYSSIDVVLMCFSMDYPDTLGNVAQRWIPEVQQYCKNGMVTSLLFITHHASKQGNVITLVSVYISYVCTIFFGNLVNYGCNLPQVVVTDFFLKINSGDTGRHSGDSA